MNIIEDKIDYFRVPAGALRRTYFVSIRTRYSYRNGYPTFHFVNVGGCVEISVAVRPPVEFYGDRINGSIDYDVAKITHIGFNPLCSVEENLPCGVGTMHMARVAMTIVRDNYDWITRFSLVDNSEVHCKEPNRFVSLSDISIATNAQTYYAKYFHARLANESLRNDYDRSMLKMSSEGDKLPLAAFLTRYDIPSSIEAVITAPYAASKTYVEFFRALRSADPQAFCVTTSTPTSWLSAFVDDVLSNDVRKNIWMQQWIIDAASVKSIVLDDIVDEWPLTDAVDVETARDSLAQSPFQRSKDHSGGTTSSFSMDDL